MQAAHDNTSLSNQLAQLSKDLARCHIPASNQLRKEIDKIIHANEEQHDITRQYVATTVTGAMNNMKKESLTQQQYEKVVESLTYKEINSRMNEITRSYPDTFEWMFDNHCDSFASWLAGDEPLYWIEGKPGSGKSTLMKFLANEPRTKELLVESSPDSDTLIITFHFWLSGSKMQRSLKGFLSSICRQLILTDIQRLKDCVACDENILQKREVNDWAEKELETILKLLLDSMDDGHRVCIFVDGLDEFDQREDIDKLLDLIKELSMLGKVKVVVSSRPENYILKRWNYQGRCRLIRLQNLTHNDMQIFVRGKLERVRTQYPPSSLNESRFVEIVGTMVQKASGVFLWVQ